MRFKQIPFIAQSAVLFACVIAFTGVAHANVGPVVQLFPTTVIEDIKETGETAKMMETNLQDIISRLDLQRQLFDESACQGAEGDPGCAQISKQLGSTYLEMLGVMGDGLPAMQSTVKRTRQSLEKQIRRQLGLNISASTLQDQLAGDAKNGIQRERPRLRGRSGVRMSDRIQQYYSLVSMGSNSTGSMAVIASDLFLDMREAEYLIEATQQEIARASLMEQLNQSFGLITPEMDQVVAGVKEILFGEGLEAGGVAGPPVALSPTAYRSEFEF